jgi:uncharacterized membrane protein
LNRGAARHPILEIAGVHRRGYAVVMANKTGSAWKRSAVKAITYRVAIVCLDFVAVYLFTHKAGVAFGFMIVSNIYTTLGYFLHERIWARIRWGTDPQTP